MKSIILISADAEWRALKELHPNLEIQKSPFGEFTNLQLSNLEPVTLFHGGWGKISAAASTQYVIDQYKPELLINLGTCGGFEGLIERGTIIMAEKTIVYDIIEQMMDADEAIKHYTTKLDLSFLPKILPAPVLRGLLISADHDIIAGDIPALTKKYKAIAADWESGAIAWVAQKNNVRCLILRGVTDLVNPETGEAYGNYELFSQHTKEVMRKLLEQLPNWQNAIDKVEQGYRGY